MKGSDLFFLLTWAWRQIPDWFPDQLLRPSQPGYWLFPHSFPSPLLANCIAFSFGIDCIDFFPPMSQSEKSQQQKQGDVDGSSLNGASKDFTLHRAFVKARK